MGEVQLLDGCCNLCPVCALWPEMLQDLHQFCFVIAVPALPETDCYLFTICVPVANCVHDDERLFHACVKWSLYMYRSVILALITPKFDVGKKWVPRSTSPAQC